MGSLARKVMKTILIVTDAWHPQVNGVVRALEKLAKHLRAKGFKVEFLEPSGFRTFPLPTYKEIRISFAGPRKIKARIEAIAPDYIHIATEGPLGILARNYCVKNNLAFSTSFHTQYPEYLRARLPVSLKFSYSILRWFHRAAKHCLVTSKTVADRLEHWGFENIANWSLGVDLETFNPKFRDKSAPEFNLPGPIYLYVGRIAVEKNPEAFLKLDLPGSKVVVGDGPLRTQLQEKYKDVLFVGAKHGKELSKFYASADCFVFPSRTDTFGLVLLEAMASGIPVAAFPVQGPLDVIGDGGAGVLDEDLAVAAQRAVKIPRQVCRTYASQFTWEASAEQFLANLPAAMGTGNDR